MTRSFILSTTAAVALMAAPLAHATENSTAVPGNSPAITETGNANVVGSTSNELDTATKRYGIGIAEYDPTRMAMPQSTYDALAAAVGDEFKTTDGERLGVVSGLTFDAQGNPELAIDLDPETPIDAETLVITLLPESLQVVDGKIFLDTTLGELSMLAQDGSKRDDETRTTVIVM